MHHHCAARTRLATGDGSRPGLEREALTGTLFPRHTIRLHESLGLERLIRLCRPHMAHSRPPNRTRVDAAGEGLIAIPIIKPGTFGSKHFISMLPPPSLTRQQ